MKSLRTKLKDPKYIQRDGKYYITANLIMLPAEKSRLYLDEKNELWLDHKNYWENETCKPQDLYVVIQSNLTDGDYFLWYSQMNEKYEVHRFHSDAGYGIKTYTQFNPEDGSSVLVNWSGHCGRIIAATNLDLKIDIYDPMRVPSIPEISIPFPRTSSSFLNAYVDTYRNGHIIKEILVEVFKPINSDDLNAEDWEDYYTEYEKCTSFMTDRDGDICSWSMDEGNKYLDKYTKVKTSHNEIIVKKVEEPPIKRDDMLLNMQYYMEYCQSNGYVTPHVWLRDYKHF